MQGRHTAHHIACLVENLPTNARCRVASNKDALWTLEADLLASIFNSLNGLIWGMSGAKGNEPPKIGPEWMRKRRGKSADAVAMSPDELLARLSEPRTSEGVNNA